MPEHLDDPPESPGRGAGYWLLFAGWLSWVALVVAAPLFSSDGPGGISAAIYEFFGMICHQRPERSFSLAGHSLAVCHRCFGLYLGLGLGLVTLPYLPRLRERLQTKPRLILIFAIPMLIDVVLRENNFAASRFSTGVLASFPIALFCWIAAEQILGRKRMANGSRLPNHN